MSEKQPVAENESVATHPANVPTDSLHRRHPNYLLVFLSLAVLTAVEVGVTYVPQIPQAPVLLTLSVFKALLVIMYFMHLRYDSKWFAFIFFIPFVLVIPMLIVLRIS
jgi:cytochrome c oxidase subunit 4